MITDEQLDWLETRFGLWTQTHPMASEIEVGLMRGHDHDWIQQLFLWLMDDAEAYAFLRFVKNKGIIKGVEGLPNCSLEEYEEEEDK